MFKLNRLLVIAAGLSDSSDLQCHARLERQNGGDAFLDV